MKRGTVGPSSVQKNYINFAREAGWLMWFKRKAGGIFEYGAGVQGWSPSLVFFLASKAPLDHDQGLSRLRLGLKTFKLFLDEIIPTRNPNCFFQNPPQKNKKSSYGLAWSEVGLLKTFRKY